MGVCGKLLLILHKIPELITISNSLPPAVLATDSSPLSIVRRNGLGKAELADRA